MSDPRRIVTVLLWTVVLGLTIGVRGTAGRRAELPGAMTDREFWALTETLSEPAGAFRYDNLLSNEPWFQKALPQLAYRHGPGGIYLGVGPEQNFTYIAALDPALAFIVDIRRGNRDLHLLYKALFDLAADRADFVSRLFSRERPAGLGPQSTADEIFAAFSAVASREERYRANLTDVRRVLVEQHRFPLSDDELRGIEHVYGNFYRFGPDITYLSSPNNRRVTGTSYESLMRATDGAETPRSYLSTDARFAIVQRLERRNLVVPVVGDFGGPKALRAIGEWLKSRGALVAAFYVSNVEDYLRKDGVWNTFCQNVATLPLDERSEFIRASAAGTAPSELDSIREEIRPCMLPSQR